MTSRPFDFGWSPFPDLKRKKTSLCVSVKQLYHLLLWKTQHRDTAQDDSCTVCCTTAVSIDTHTRWKHSAEETQTVVNTLVPGHTIFLYFAITTPHPPQNLLNLSRWIPNHYKCLISSTFTQAALSLSISLWFLMSELIVFQCVWLMSRLQADFSGDIMGRKPLERSLLKKQMIHFLSMY